MEENAKMLKFFDQDEKLITTMRGGAERHWLKISKFHNKRKLRHGIALINVDWSMNGRVAFLRAIHIV